MEKHHQLSDQTFAEKFADCTLDPGVFSHEGHLRLAWIHLRKFNVEQACTNICDQILQFDIVHGKGEKFHRTITIAAIKAVHHFMQKSHSDNFADFINEFPRLKYNFIELINVHYGIDIYNSEEARWHYIEPDLVPFT